MWPGQPAVLEADPDVLEAPVLPEQPGADGADARDAARTSPCRSIQSGVEHLHVVVEQQQVLALAVHGAEVDLGREVERAVVSGRPAAGRRRSPQLGEHRRVGRGVDDADDLVVLVGRASRRCCARSARPARPPRSGPRGRCPVVGMTMLTSGSRGRARARGGRRPGRSSSRSTRACRPIRSQCACTRALPGLERPRLRRSRRRPRPRSRASASGRGRGGRGRRSRARSVTFSTRSQSWEPSNSGSKPPTSSTSDAAQDAEVAGVHLRPHPLRRPVGLEERPGVAAGAVDLVLVGVDVVGLGVVARAPRATQARASGWSLSSWSSRTTNSPRAIARASLEAATMPPFSLAALDPDPRVLRAAPPRASRATWGRLERVVDQAQLPVARSSGGGPTRSIARSTSAGRFVDRREDREARLRHASASASGGILRRSCRTFAGSPAAVRSRSEHVPAHGFRARRPCRAPLPSSASLATSRSRSRRTSSRSRASSSASSVGLPGTTGECTGSELLGDPRRLAVEDPDRRRRRRRRRSRRRAAGRAAPPAASTAVGALGFDRSRPAPARRSAPAG